MTGLGKEGESPTDFNECISKDELKKLVDDQRTYIDGKFNELMRTINGLVTRLSMLNNSLLDGSTDATLMMVLRTRMRMLSLMMMMIVMRTIFGAIVKVWEIIKIVVIMILSLKKIYHDSFCWHC